jgi:hypothetical protein
VFIPAERAPVNRDFIPQQDLSAGAMPMRNFQPVILDQQSWVWRQRLTSALSFVLARNVTSSSQRPP